MKHAYTGIIMLSTVTKSAGSLAMKSEYPHIRVAYMSTEPLYLSVQESYTSTHTVT